MRKLFLLVLASGLLGSCKSEEKQPAEKDYSIYSSPFTISGAILKYDIESLPALLDRLEKKRAENSQNVLSYDYTKWIHLAREAYQKKMNHEAQVDFDFVISQLNDGLLENKKDAELFWFLNQELNEENIKSIQDRNPILCLHFIADSIAVRKSGTALTYDQEFNYCPDQPLELKPNQITKKENKDYAEDRNVQNFEATLDLNFQTIADGLDLLDFNMDMTIENGGKILVTPYLQLQNPESQVMSSREYKFRLAKGGHGFLETDPLYYRILKEETDENGDANGREIKHHNFSFRMLQE